jgi:uncharacterized surface protein with fasciclin (FAS1) repeats
MVGVVSMKNTLRTIIYGFAFMLAAQTPANASGTLDETLKSQSDLSAFYQIAANTGVLAELQADTKYTVFAPANFQFEKIAKSYDKCAADSACKEQLKNIVRNHIVKGVQHLSDAVKYRGSLFGISGHPIPITDAGAGRLNIEGHSIIDTAKYDNGVVHTIDGIIASRYELASLELFSKEGEVKESVKTETVTIPDPACGEKGCPRSSTTTTTIIRSFKGIGN